jgi:tight adherence protein B
MPAAIVKLLFLILVFGATMLAVEGAVQWFASTRRDRQIVTKRLQQVEQRIDHQRPVSSLRRERHVPLFHGSSFEPYFAGVDRVLREAGLHIGATEAFLRMIAAALGIFILLLAVATFRGFPMSLGALMMMALFAGAIGVVFPMMYFARRRERRKQKLAEQFPIALDLFVRGLRAGHPISSALDLLTSDMRDPIRGEFALVIDEVTYGLSLREALENMANRCGLEDMRMFVVSLAVQSETGGNLAEILDGLARVIRERASMVLKVRALSSEGRMSAMMLTALPVLTFCVVFTFNSKFYLDVANDKAFAPGFAGLFLLYLLGVAMIRRMIDLKV